MKEKLKFIPAVLHIFAMICTAVLLPFVEIGSVELSLLDIIKIGFGKYESSFLVNGVKVLIKSYTSSCLYVSAALLVTVLVTVILNCALDGKNAYIAGITGQVILNAIAVVLFINVKDKLNEIQEMTEFFEMGGRITFGIILVFVWCGLELLALILNIKGCLMYRKSQADEYEEIYTDNIPLNPTRNQKSGYMTEGEYKRQIQKLEEEKERKRRIEAQKKREEERKEQIQKYTGTIIGMTGEYAMLAYELKKLELVYLSQKGSRIVVQKEKSEGVEIAELYYIPQYREYCIKPMQKTSVFLESGQPLGRNRSYYLPRATKIYIYDKDHMFNLA